MEGGNLYYVEIGFSFCVTDEECGERGRELNVSFFFFMSL